MGRAWPATAWVVLGACAAVALAAGCGDAHPGPSAQTLAAERRDSYTEARDGLVVSSIEAPDGTISTQIWDDNQLELLFAMTYSVDPRVFTFDHTGLGVRGVFPDADHGGTPTLPAMNGMALGVYGTMPSSAHGEVRFDGYGCDALVGGGSSWLLWSCGDHGACCDTHDQCYSNHGCSAASWKCSLKPCDAMDSQGHPVKGLLCRWYTDEDDCAAASTQDKSDACAQCNTQVVTCKYGKVVGKSSCCAEASDSPEACGQDRPDNCETGWDGKCHEQCTMGTRCKEPGELCQYSYECAGASYCDTTCKPSKQEGEACAGHWECGSHYCNPRSGKCEPPCVGDNCKPPEPPGDPGSDDDPGALPGVPGSVGAPLAGYGAPVLAPVDPNEKLGPEGTGENHEVIRSDSLAYEIRFENMEGANATAQQVLVVDYLHAGLDWSSVEFSEVAFGGRVIPIAEGTSFETTDIPPNDGCVITGTANGDLAVEVSTSINVQNGRIEARLQVVDTATGELPADPYAGILPPNGTVCSEGHLVFRVKPLMSVAPGTVLTNSASIVFDANAPITTNEVWNTVGE